MLWVFAMTVALAISADALYRWKEPITLKLSGGKLTARWFWRTVTVDISAVRIEKAAKSFWAGERVSILQLPDRRIKVFSELVDYAEFVELMTRLTNSDQAPPTVGT